MKHRVLFDTAGVRRYIPLPRRGLGEHVTEARANQAQALEVEANAARAVRVLIAVTLIPRRLGEDNAIPVRFHLIRDDLCHRGARVLAHLRAVAGYFDAAVFLKGNE